MKTQTQKTIKRVLIGLGLITSNLFTVVKPAQAECTLDIQIVVEHQSKNMYRIIDETTTMLFRASLARFEFGEYASELNRLNLQANEQIDLFVRKCNRPKLMTVAEEQGFIYRNEKLIEALERESASIKRRLKADQRL